VCIPDHLHPKYAQVDPKSCSQSSTRRLWEQPPQNCCVAVCVAVCVVVRVAVCVAVCEVALRHQHKDRENSHPAIAEAHVAILHQLHSAMHSRALQRTATHCNKLQHTTPHCIALHCTALHCNHYIALQRTAAQHTLTWSPYRPIASVTHCNILHRTATHCNTLQHTATQCSAANSHLKPM